MTTQATHTLLHIPTGEIVQMTVPEIVEEINRDRSEDWTSYNEGDWAEAIDDGWTEYYWVRPSLIAAAPSMLDALETIAAGNTDPDRMVEIAREAIAQMEGAQ